MLIFYSGIQFLVADLSYCECISKAEQSVLMIVNVEALTQVSGRTDFLDHPGKGSMNFELDLREIGTRSEMMDAVI